MATAPTTATTYALLLYSSSSSALAGSFSFAGTGLSETLANGATGTLETIPGELELVIGSAGLTAGNVTLVGHRERKLERYDEMGPDQGARLERAGYGHFRRLDHQQRGYHYPG